jgi:hypothetical protein
LIKNILNLLKNKSLTNKIDAQSILISQLISSLNANKKTLAAIHHCEYKVFSQWGEDGILDWLINKIPGIPRSFIEFGVEDYTESNTRLLLLQKNWNGLVIDGSKANINSIKSGHIYWKHNLKAIQAFITKDNINEIFLDNGYKDDVGILSVDIDGNDYFVWESISVINPIIVVCEYNAVLGDLLALSIPYDPNFVRTKSHYSNLYFGASVRALVSLGSRKGYTFIGTTSTGANAFFIRNDHADLITPFLKNVSAFPSKFREARDEKGDLQFASGNNRKEIIQSLPFLNLNTDKVAPLGSFGEIYSLSWQKGESVDL